jgi:predicted NBD/HSP70 family sugar kinase
LETLVSKRGLTRLLQEARDRGLPCAIEDLVDLRSKAVDLAFRDGCRSTIEAIETMACHLAWAMNVIASIVNPDVFVLGGGIGERLGSDLLPLIEEHRQTAVFVAANAPYEVRIGELGPAAVAIGASVLE